jgi:hypothetical protein
VHRDETEVLEVLEGHHVLPTTKAPTWFAKRQVTHRRPATSQGPGERGGANLDLV